MDCASVTYRLLSMLDFAREHSQSRIYLDDPVVGCRGKSLEEGDLGLAKVSHATKIAHSKPFDFRVINF